MTSMSLPKIRLFLKLRYASRTSILFDISLTVIAGMFFIGGIMKTQGWNIERPSDAAKTFSTYEYSLVNIGNKQYRLYIADTPDKQMKGLSSITSMKSYEGMMFEFDNAGVRSFWMKDMNFPLDFVFVFNDSVVDIHENVKPASFPDSILSRLPANKVIELNAGEVSENGIKLGEKIEVHTP